MTDSCINTLESIQTGNSFPSDLRIQRSAEVAIHTLKRQKVAAKQREDKYKILSGSEKLLTVANFMPQDLHTR